MELTSRNSKPPIADGRFIESKEMHALNVTGCHGLLTDSYKRQNKSKRLREGHVHPLQFV